MACSVVILPTAQREREAITDYLLQFGSSSVASFLDEYEKQLRLIADGTVECGLSRFTEFAVLGYRMAPVNNYLFLYFREGDTVTVAHFFHQSQDYARLVEFGEG